MEKDAKTIFSKTNLAFSLFAVSGWLAFYMRSSQPEKVTEKIVYKDREVVKEKIVYKDREVVKEKLVTKDIIRTVTKPDGTTIVTVSKVGVKSDEKSSEQVEVFNSEKEKEHVEEKESSRVSPAYQSTYTFGIAVIFDYKKPLTREYEFEIGRRLWISPVWGSASVNTNKELQLGLKWEK